MERNNLDTIGNYAAIPVPTTKSFPHLIVYGYGLHCAGSESLLFVLKQPPLYTPPPPLLLACQMSFVVVAAADAAA